MGNKGKVYYVFCDKTFIGDPAHYLQQIESVMKDKENLRV